MRYMTRSCLQSLKLFSSGETTLKVQPMSYWSSPTTRTSSTSSPQNSSPDDKSDGWSTSLGSTPSSAIGQDTLAPSQMPSHARKMCTPRGDNVYALATPHNFQLMFKPSQLLRAIVLDSAALLISIKQGLATDPVAQNHF